MERRSFLKTTCIAGVAAMVPAILIELSGCKVTAIYHTSVKDKKIWVPAALFTENNLQIIRANELDEDIALRKESDGSYTALLMRCTHADNPVTSTGNGFVCTLHGSTFDKEGNVTKGPANRTMQHFKTENLDNDIAIYIN